MSVPSSLFCVYLIFSAFLAHKSHLDQWKKTEKRSRNHDFLDVRSFSAICVDDSDCISEWNTEGVCNGRKYIHWTLREEEANSHRNYRKKRLASYGECEFPFYSGFECRTDDDCWARQGRYFFCWKDPTGLKEKVFSRCKLESLVL